MAETRAEEILKFWFGAQDAAARSRWFTPDPAFDDTIRTRFSEDASRASRGELDAWTADPRGALALVILLDQFPRNVHRGSELAFASDERAVAVTRAAIAAGQDRQLSLVERTMMYMPLMHAEDRELQHQCLAVFRALSDDAVRTGAARDVLDYVRAANEYASKHAAIVEQFSRFPHRNAVLGRTSTGLEVQFLTEPGSRF
jgi:uncharacterized protein (DUF924 family)